MAFPDTLDVDVDGYPSADRIDEIKGAAVTDDPRQWLTNVFPGLVSEMPCGSCDIWDGIDDFGKRIKIVAYSTGGWSGQEELIHAVENGPCGWLWLWSWRRGGHYEFRVPIPD